ncbi:NAD(P)/FAD-dependent oxidoreductase [Halorussus salinisoli]|uniref:NAD(P)/FAD-dependent oxidoreductase n=1 Tax=Halorussus salinisoli TaxID=2558242 RepID=UPI0010C1DBFC|nr:FAD-dependent oxidoreductase [Halorussus salinisoli]
MPTPRYVIVGGGIVGASVAYHLSERTDDPITVYERTDLASETTSKSTAMIGIGGPDPHSRLKHYGFRLYNEFFAEPAASPRYRQAGRLRVATSPSGATTLERLAADESEQAVACESVRSSPGIFGDGLMEYIPGDEVRKSLLIPPLNTDIVDGALYRPRYGYIQGDSRTLGPRDLAFEFIERAKENGVTFETNTTVTDIRTNGDRVTGVTTDETDTVDADEVVCAAGPWNAQLAETVGLDLPVEHVLSPVFALELDRPFPYTLPAIKSHESSVGLHRKRDDVVLVTYTPGENDGATRYDPETVGDTAPDAVRRTALEWAERLVPQLHDAELVDEWVGVGTSTPDGNPIVGWTPLEGLSVAVTMSGIQLAPAVGSIVARQLVAGDPTEFYDDVSISRFDGYTDATNC